MNAKKIEDNSIIQNLIDFSFQNTLKWNTFLMIFYIALYCIPLLCNIFFVRNWLGTMICCLCMSVVQLQKFAFEYMDLSQNKNGLIGYISETSNQIDVSVLLVFIFWSISCGIYPTESFIPDELKA